MKRTLMYVLSALILSSMVVIGLSGCGSSSKKSNQNVSSVVVFPQTATIWIGQTQTFTATAYDASGNPVPNVQFTWSVDTPTATTSTTTGNSIVVTGNQAGIAQVAVTQVAYSTTSSSGGIFFYSSPATLTVNGNVGGGYVLELAMGTANIQGQSATGLAWLATIRASNGTNLQTWNLTFTGSGIQSSLTHTYKSDSHSQYSFDGGYFPNQPATSGTYYIKAVSADGSVTLMTATTIDASQVLPLVTNINGTSQNSINPGSAYIDWSTLSGTGSYSYQAAVIDATTGNAIPSDYYSAPIAYVYGLTVGDSYTPLVAAFSIDLSALEADASQAPSEVTGQFNMSIGSGPTFTE